MPADLVTAIRAVAAVAPGVTRRLIEAFAHHLPKPNGHSPVDDRGITAREREVLVEPARARSNSEIAPRLCVTEATVKVHVSRILPPRPAKK